MKLVPTIEVKCGGSPGLSWRGSPLCVPRAGPSFCLGLAGGRISGAKTRLLVQGLNSEVTFGNMFHLHEHIVNILGGFSLDREPRCDVLHL